MAGCGTGSVEIAELLLPALADVDLSLVAEAAACHQNLALVKFFIENGLRVSVPKILSSAIRTGDLETASFIRSIVPKVQFSNIEETLAAAIHIGNLEGVRFVFDNIDSSDKGVLAEKLIPVAIQARENRIISLLMACNPMSATSIASAVRSQNVELLRSVLESGHSSEFINQLCSDGSGTPLCIAAAGGDLEIVKLLLSVPGIDANLCNSSGETPLIIASAAKNLPMMKLLIEFGGDVLLDDFRQINTAFLAAFRPRPTRPGPGEPGNSGHIFRYRTFGVEGGLGATYPPLDLELADLTFELVPLFLSFPSLDVNFFQGNESILIIAARTRNYQLMKEVLKIPNVNPDPYDDAGNTPLLYCADSGNLEAIRLLINEGHANINTRNFHGATAFSLAVFHGHKDIVTFLLTHPSFDLDKSNGALALVVVSLERAGLIEMFINMDFNINQAVEQQNPHNDTHKRATPLLWAITRNATNLFNQIIAHPRFDPVQSGIGRALFAAVRAVNLEMLTSLLPLAGDALNVRNRNNETLLTYACLRGNLPIVQTIVNLPNFDPQRQDVIHALGAAIRADCGILIPLLTRIPGVDVNRPLPRGINGLRVRMVSRFGFRWFPDDIEHEEDGVTFPELSSGVPPLIAAARAGRNDVVSALLASPGLDINAKGEYGQTVLSEWLQDPRAFQLLEVEGLDVNACDLEGETALFYAFMRLDSLLLTNLVRKGIDLNIRNIYGVSFVCIKLLGNLRTLSQGLFCRSNQWTGSSICGA
jgi:ankyrin repeat protein